MYRIGVVSALRNQSVMSILSPCMRLFRLDKYPKGHY